MRQNGKAGLCNENECLFQVGCRNASKHFQGPDFAALLPFKLETSSSKSTFAFRIQSADGCCNFFCLRHLRARSGQSPRTVTGQLLPSIQHFRRAVIRSTASLGNLPYNHTLTIRLKQPLAHSRENGRYLLQTGHWYFETENGSNSALPLQLSTRCHHGWLSRSNVKLLRETVTKCLRNLGRFVFKDVLQKEGLGCLPRYLPMRKRHQLVGSE